MREILPSVFGRSGMAALILALTLPAFRANAEPLVIAKGTGRESPQQPQAAVSATGALHVVYGAGDDIYLATSSDSGVSFSQPQHAATCRNMSLGMRRGPRVAVSGPTVVITAIGGEQGRGRDGDLQAWRRTGDGEWQGPSRVNDVDASAREGLHAMASGPDGSLWCVWLDLRNGRTELRAAKSTDAGASWSPNFLVYQSPEKSICECCHPSLLVTPNGEVTVLFRNSLNGDRDMYLTTSRDGSTFSPAVSPGRESWRLDACPMDGGMLVETPAGGVATVWRRKQDIFLTTPEAGEQRLDSGEQPWITGTDRGLVVVWSAARDQDLRLWRSRSLKTETVAHHARDAVVVTSPDRAAAVAFWEEREGSERFIKGLVIEP